MKRHVILVVWLVAASVVCAQPAEDVENYEAVCRPSKEVTLAFTRPGQIEEIFVQVGDRVRKGDLLVQLENSVEVAQVEQLKNEAEDDTHIQAAEAELEQSKIDLEKLQEAFGSNAVTEYELDHAKLNVTIKELSLKLAKFKQEQNHRRYEEASLQLARMAIDSPIDGIVEILYVESGESIDQLQEVIHLVETDPLWIDVPVPLARASELSVGDPADVSLSTDPDTVLNGKIIFIASVADAASETLRVRVELPNEAESPAGQRVFVSFPPEQVRAAAADKMPDSDETEAMGETGEAPVEEAEHEDESSGELLAENEVVSND
jgi:RND family efflux transporter MFP subunit